MVNPLLVYSPRDENTYRKNAWLEYIAKNSAIENPPLLHAMQDENVYRKKARQE
jgi:hypothetical protein